MPGLPPALAGDIGMRAGGLRGAGRVTFSEFMFLAIGLFLGVGGGVALIQVLRARPSARGEASVAVAQPVVVAQTADPSVVAEPVAVAERVAVAEPVAVALAADPTLLAGPAVLVAPVAPSGPCADERRLADDRCEVATRARAQAAAAAEAFRLVQRTYDAHIATSTTAAESTDPKTVRHLKEEAQRAFRIASRASESPQDAEAAARTWLQAINRINREAAAAGLANRRGREAATALRATLDRLGHESDAALFAAEKADAACLAARTALAECDAKIVAGPDPGGVPARPLTEPIPSGTDRDGALRIAFQGGSVPRIFGLVHGNPDALASLVAGMAGDDPDELRRWDQAFTGLVEAVLADAIEQSFLRFPLEHPFWGAYPRQQQRDIARALSSLGFRFDGLGGWVDERLPSQRDLSLALGYSGIDPVRVRQWPSELQTAELFREVEVAADEYLAGAAGDLSLAEMVVMLGPRADGLVDLWNHWGRIRPLLLDET